VPLPLVFDLHGYGESIEIHRSMSNMIAKGEERWFVVVTPQADDPVPRWDATIGSADTTFLTAVLDHVVATHCIDLARVYVTGLSNGAFMASVMACQIPDRIAAIAPVAGLQDPAGCEIDDPVPVIAFHGTADTFVSYDGGLGASVADLPTDDGGTIGTGIVGGGGPTVEEIAAAWAVRNGCAAEAPLVEAVSAEVDRLGYVHCPSNGQVDLYRVNGGGHAWPGSAFSQSIEPIIGHTTMTIDATDLIWQFFDAHPRRLSAQPLAGHPARASPDGGALELDHLAGNRQTGHSDHRAGRASARRACASSVASSGSAVVMSSGHVATTLAAHSVQRSTMMSNSSRNCPQSTSHGSRSGKAPSPSRYALAIPALSPWRSSLQERTRSSVARMSCFVPCSA
jgi:polyhydroxybutyrate depolymerase